MGRLNVMQTLIIWVIGIKMPAYLQKGEFILHKKGQGSQSGDFILHKRDKVLQSGDFVLHKREIV